MKKILLVLVAFALVGCESATAPSDPTTNAAFTGSSWMHDKKCASCAYTAEYAPGSDRILLIDTSTTPAEIISVVAGGDDQPAVFSMARLNDAIYYTDQYGTIFAVDLADPRHPVARWHSYYSNNGESGSFEDVHIDGSRLIARFLVGNSGYYTGSGVAEWDIKHNPFSPELVSYTLD